MQTIWNRKRFQDLWKEQIDENYFGRPLKRASIQQIDKNYLEQETFSRPLQRGYVLQIDENSTSLPKMLPGIAVRYKLNTHVLQG